MKKILQLVPYKRTACIPRYNESKILEKNYYVNHFRQNFPS